MKIPIESERTDEVRVSFKHRLQRNGKDRPFTEATVEWTTREGQTRTYSGIAYVHPNDAPERKIGRKIALARALCSLPRDERRQIWAALINIKRMRV